MLTVGKLLDVNIDFIMLVFKESVGAGVMNWCSPFLNRFVLISLSANGPANTIYATSFI